MEFSYWVSEAEYARAWKAARSGSYRLIRFLTWFMLFWLSLFLVVILLWVFAYYTTPHLPAQQHPYSSASPSGAVYNVLPFLLVLCIWAYVLFGFTPMRIRRMYRKDPSMQGQFTVSITPDSISTSNTAGMSSQGGWNAYKGWSDGKDIIVLLSHSGTYLILSLAGLTEPQRLELRAIVSGALPRK
jgi:hypothetical protein